MKKSLIRKYIKNILNEENEKHEWRPANRKEFMLDKEGMEQSDKDNVEHFLKSLGLMEMKITKKQLRKIIRETIGWGMGPDVVGKSGRSYGANSKDDGSYFRDVIVMSPNGDSVLVDGEETYVQDVPMQLGLMGFPMSDIDADNLIFALEESMADGYVELEVKYENGVWSW